MSDASSNGNGSLHRGESWPTSGVGAPPRAVPRAEPLPRRVVATAGFLLDATRRRRGGRIALWLAVAAMGISGLILIAQPVITDAWAGRIQDRLEREFAATDAEQARAQVGVKKAEGKPVTRLRIPKLGVDKIVVEGITGNALRAGLGHYPNSALPGDPTGNAAIAGHRTGFGEPFRHLDKLREGDRIELITPLGKFIYEVVGGFDGHSNPWITHAKDWTVISPAQYGALTLTTCDPPGTSKNRLIVRARLVGSEPLT